MGNIDHEIEDLLDNFEFKPVTEGLGFHHSLKEKKHIATNLNQTADSLKADIEARVNILTKNENIQPATGVNRGELAPFYDDTAKVELAAHEIVLSENESSADFLTSSMAIRCLAWLVDLVILLTSMIVTFASIVFFAELPLETISVFMISDQMLLSFGFISIMYYIFYFTFLDKTAYSTLGKNLLGLKLVSLKKTKRVSLMQSFFRVALTLISIPLLGLPILLGIHDKLTETQVLAK